ncbi:hypothetical protein PsYK624_066360 [Phanerochaete sordida]|uniref:Uncharacterized protein n=1 Tax=Phanerochaete sordida TaxID=48140 RepID=A0A9P3G9F5_9APHY|nr:hypothetical protein PsYK624_066360 [Phanerochaete sordida]
MLRNWACPRFRTLYFTAPSGDNSVAAFPARLPRHTSPSGISISTTRTRSGVQQATFAFRMTSEFLADKKRRQLSLFFQSPRSACGRNGACDELAQGCEQETDTAQAPLPTSRWTSSSLPPQRNRTRRSITPPLECTGSFTFDPQIAGTISLSSPIASPAAPSSNSPAQGSSNGRRRAHDHWLCSHRACAVLCSSISPLTSPLRLRAPVIPASDVVSPLRSRSRSAEIRFTAATRILQGRAIWTEDHGRYRASPGDEAPELLYSSSRRHSRFWIPRTCPCNSTALRIVLASSVASLGSSKDGSEDLTIRAICRTPGLCRCV